MAEEAVQQKDAMEKQTNSNTLSAVPNGEAKSKLEVATVDLGESKSLSIGKKTLSPEGKALNSAAITQNQKATMATDIAAAEQWDSGALGGNYLNQQVETDNQQLSQAEAGQSLATAEKAESLKPKQSIRNDATKKTQRQLALQAKSIIYPDIQKQLVTKPDKPSAKGFKKDLDKHKENSKAVRSPAMEPQATKSLDENSAVTASRMAQNTDSQSAAPNSPKNKTTKLGSVKPHDSKTKAVLASGKDDTTVKSAKTHPPQPLKNTQTEPTSQSKVDDQKTSKPQNQLALTSRGVVQAPKIENPQPDSDKTEQKNVEPQNSIDSNTARDPQIIEKTSENVVIIDSGNESASNNLEPVEISSNETELAINKAQLNQLLAKLTSAYEKGNLQQLLSVLSKDVRSDDGSTRSDLKDGYRKLFNITDMRQMTISSVTWSKKEQFIHGKGEFELRVREKGADTVSSYGGVISLDVENRAGGAVITQLNYDYKR